MPFVINTCTIKINIFIASTNFQWRFRSASKVSKPASMGVIQGISEDRGKFKCQNIEKSPEDENIGFCTKSVRIPNLKCEVCEDTFGWRDPHQ